MPADRTAVISGVSSGIGRAIAAHLLADGWTVIGLSRRQPDLSAQRFSWRHCDLTHPRSTEGAVSDIGTVQALIHAAGFQVSGRLGALDPDDGTHMYAVHVDAAIRLANSLVDRITAGGRILLIGSRTAVGVAGKSQYAATKAALRALARSWATELAPRRITVNVIEPGPTETAMLTDPARATTPPVTPPLGRLIHPEEVAALAHYLLTDNSAMITGQHLTICGGASL
ncbi:NAD(P)-dependent dehydrogenase (short-subunit alcohol dehydrogenase family) [Kribbella antiqua]|uniref:NAD(P)-dependent dehydrogenase (Short-subunit alcohol dehydrogenase family) n=1 Tax=Kribbella antiqua TaxID=2512217 RepID=A0A4V2S2H6_9ACTN|nr:SDR family oxidoreductase [Kribbella antiqua]TCO40480.1 NAD(P)-dependent dehydrogenase (short-subunit alcohol dehydrogenase family) [Kribbella antiqua]